MKFIKSIKEAYEPQVSGYINNEYKYDVTNGGAISAAEYGSVVLTFEKDGKSHEINFDIYEITNGINFIEIENLETAKKLDIPIEGKDRLDSNDELYGIIFDLYSAESTSSDIPKLMKSGIYRDMEYQVEQVSAEGVIEEGWLELLISSKDETKSFEVSFDIRETSDGDAEVTPNSDEDEERLNELGIEFDDDFKTQIMQIYGNWSNETRSLYLDSVQNHYQKHISMFEEFSEIQKWKIYAGLGGGFGGSHYIETFTGTKQDAESLAYQYAIEEYESYEGSHGIRTVDEIMEEDDVDYEDAQQIYNDERESWLDYYVKPDDGIKESEENNHLYEKGKKTDFVDESIRIKDPNSLIVGKKYKITWPVYDDYDEGLKPEVETYQVVDKNRDGYILKHLEHGWTINKHPNMLEDCEIELLEEKAKTPGERYKGHHIPKKYLTGPQPGKMKKEIDKFRGKKEYKKDWDADYTSGKGGEGKRVKTKKSKATLAYQKMFGKK